MDKEQWENWAQFNYMYLGLVSTGDGDYRIGITEKIDFEETLEGTERISAE